MSALRDDMTPAELEAASTADDAETRYGRWSHESMLLARLIDEVAMSRYVLTAVNTPAEARRPDLPQPVPRPGVRRRNQGPAPRAVTYLQGIIHQHEEAVANGG